MTPRPLDWLRQHPLQDDPHVQEYDRMVAGGATPYGVATPRPVSVQSKNPLRPSRLDAMIGQAPMRRLLRRMIDASHARHEPLDHVLLVGPAGMGKTTIANVIAAELGVAMYQVEAPVSHETLLALGEVMREGDILFVDEIHQQAIMERRGRTTNTQPEVFLSVLEDFTLASDAGVIAFPHITVVGATTDEGMLPDPFIDRFPIRPHFEPYSFDELAVLARFNATRLNFSITPEACSRFASASRGVPRIVNNYVKNATRLTPGSVIDAQVALEVIEDLNATTIDGLTRDQQGVLTFLYEHGMRVAADGTVSYKASLSTLATAIGKSRDTKAIVLRVEPFLIQRGYLQVTHGGRQLTDAGVSRARELLGLHAAVAP